MNRKLLPLAAMHAAWTTESDGYALRFHAGKPTNAWSPVLLAISTAVGLASGLLVFSAAQDVGAAIMTALCVGVPVAFMVGYLRLASGAQQVTATFTRESLVIEDGTDTATIALEDIRRLIIVHDGTSARVSIDAAHERFHFSIGQLYRHNRLERYVAEVPQPVCDWLSLAGIVSTESHKRGQLRSVFLRATH